MISHTRQIDDDVFLFHPFVVEKLCMLPHRGIYSSKRYSPRRGIVGWRRIPVTTGMRTIRYKNRGIAPSREGDGRACKPVFSIAPCGFRSLVRHLPHLFPGLRVDDPTVIERLVVRSEERR